MSSAIHLLRREEADAAGKGRGRSRRSSPLIPILPDEFLRRDRDVASRFLPQSGCALPKSSAPGAQGFFQNEAMLGFSVPPVLRSPARQRFDNIPGTSRTKS
jgi:hypothetical protein